MEDEKKLIIANRFQQYSLKEFTRGYSKCLKRQMKEMSCRCNATCNFKSLEKVYGREILKEITGPENSADVTDYWRRVKPGFDGELVSNDFGVVRCTPFQGNGVLFSYAVSIKVSMIHLANSTSDGDSDNNE